MVAPNKLKAFADADPGMAALNDPSVDMADYDDPDDDEDGAAPAEDPKTRGLGLIGQWKDLGQSLTAEAGEIIDSAHDIGGDLLLAKVPEDATEAVEEDFEGLPDELKVCLAKYVADLPPDDVTAVATALIDGHDGETEDADVSLVSKYLTAMASLAKEEVDPADLEDEDEDDEEEEDEDDEDDDDAGDGDGDGGES
jgi:hypothetical protein